MIKAIRSAIAIKAKVNMIQSIIDLMEQVEPKPRNYDSITCIGCENQAQTTLSYQRTPAY